MKASRTRQSFMTRRARVEVASLGRQAKFPAQLGQALPLHDYSHCDEQTCHPCVMRESGQKTKALGRCDRRTRTVSLSRLEVDNIGGSA